MTDAAGTGPKFGPPLQARFERDLSPEVHLVDEFSSNVLDWWVQVYEEHRIDLHQGKHPSNIYACRWCDGLENVRTGMPEHYRNLFRYVRWRMYIEGRPE